MWVCLDASSVIFVPVSLVIVCSVGFRVYCLGVRVVGLGEGGRRGVQDFESMVWLAKP